MMKTIGYIGLFAAAGAIDRSGGLLQLVGGFVGLLVVGAQGFLNQRTE